MILEVIFIELCLHVSIFQGTQFLKGCLTPTVTLGKIRIIINSDQVQLYVLTSSVLRESKDK